MSVQCKLNTNAQHPGCVKLLAFPAPETASQSSVSQESQDHGKGVDLQKRFTSCQRLGPLFLSTAESCGVVSVPFSSSKVPGLGICSP